MALSKNLELFYKEIFPKVKYDKTTSKYKLELSSYIPLKLTKKQFRQLEKICIKNNIIIEKLPAILSLKETEQLFTRLNYLKTQIETDLNSKYIHKCQEEIYQIRTKLFEGHQLLIYRILFDNITNLEELSLKEDIIQSSYELLIHAIDNYDIEKSNGQTFRWYLYTYTSKNIIRNAIYLKNNGSQNKDFMNMINIREKIEESHAPSVQELSLLTGLSEVRIKELLQLEQILNADSIERIKEDEISDLIDNSKEEHNEYGTIDIEEIVSHKILQDLLILLIDTLPNEQQKEIIKLYSGLDKESTYTNSQIADILGISRQRVEQHRDDAIKNLSHSSRVKYIKELVKGYTQIELPKESFEDLETDKKDLVYEKIEKYLFQQLNKEELTNIILSLDSKYHDILLTYFGLTQDKYMSYKEINNSLGMPYTTYITKRKKALSILRIFIKEKYIKNNPNEEIKTVLDYLMYNYLNKPRNNIKIRKKDGTY